MSDSDNNSLMSVNEGELSKENPPVEFEEAKNKYDDVFNEGYSWIILLSCYLIVFCSWGNNSAYSIYLAYYLNNNSYDGGTHIGYAALGGLTFGTGFMLGPFINYFVGYIGIRGILITGTILQTAGLLLTSFASHHRIWQLYLCQGVLQSFGLVALGVPSFTILPRWFKNSDSPTFSFKNRLLATSQGIAISATGTGGLTYVLGMQKVIEVSGIRWALRAQAIINVGLLTIAISLMKVKSTQKVKSSFNFIDVKFFKYPGFYLSVCFNCFSQFGYVVVLYCMASYTMSLGYSAHDGSTVAAMVLVGTAIGRPIVGFAGDQIGPITTSMLSYSISALFVFAMWIPARNLATLIVLGLILGALVGTLFTTMVPIEIRLIGGDLQRLNTMFAMNMPFLGLTAVVAPLIAFAISSDIVSPVQYQNCQIIVGCFFTASVMISSLIRGFIITKDELTRNITLAPNQYVNTQVPLGLWMKNIFKLNHFKQL